MSSYLTKDLKLKEYIQIVVNLDQPRETGDQSKLQDIEEQKLGLQDEQYEKDDVNSICDPVIYSIKEVTDNKNENQIVELIKEELELVDNDIQIWNQMINSIARMSINNSFQNQSIIFFSFIAIWANFCSKHKFTRK